ncbi:MAG: type I polyketide synthase, partial [Pseudomonadota bacterium]
MKDTNNNAYHGLEIAIIGMAARLPDAINIEEFWHNLKSGHESVKELDQEYLIAQGLETEKLSDPNWCRIGAPIADFDKFDAEFFGYSPREAELLDPQQRLFLQCTWHALEHANCDPMRSQHKIGVFAGAGMNGYQFNLYSNSELRQQVSPYELYVANDKDFLTTRVSYKLGLTGPSLDIQTACSSSLVAVHQACQSLIAGECGIAIAGGVALSRQIGYPKIKDSIYADDGHCKAFDAEASGTVPGNGVGAVVLKRLEDAQNDNDDIIAIIKGSAVNNDGSRKVSYTAPSVDAQIDVIRTALRAADVSPESIHYIEAHGTGTAMSDPIEISALSQAFKSESVASTSNESHSCAIGSVKTNIGHLDAAAGIAGLIKTALMIHHRQLVPSLHYQTANPHIDFGEDLFYVNTEAKSWQTQANQPHRAAVSSFGIGGTNAHLILEQAPHDHVTNEKTSTSVTPQLFVISAKSSEALVEKNVQLKQLINGSVSLNAAAWMYQTGRQHFSNYRISIAANTTDDLVNKIEAVENNHDSFIKAKENPSQVWLFPGQGSQQLAMGKYLYQECETFKQHLDECDLIASHYLDQSLVSLVCGDSKSIEDKLEKTAYLQPSLFAFQYCLAKRYLSWGLKPLALMGHSLGEWVAACISNVMPLATALPLVIKRAQLMQQMPTGSMLAVMASHESVKLWLSSEINIAAINTDQMCVLSGTDHEISRLEQYCNDQAITSKRLACSHAFHSSMMQDAADSLKQELSNVILNAPCIPFISNVSGTWIENSQAMSAEYWSDHMLSTVQFSKGINTLLELHEPVILEIGIGSTLRNMIETIPSINDQDIPIISCLPANTPKQSDASSMLDSLGQLWSYGLTPDWRTLHDSVPAKCRLPLYPFQTQSYWISRDQNIDNAATASNDSIASGNPDKCNEWIYTSVWQQSPVSRYFLPPGRGKNWLLIIPQGNEDQKIFINDLAQQLNTYIENSGDNVFTVHQAETFSQTDYRSFESDCNSLLGCQKIRDLLDERSLPADYIVDLRWLADESSSSCIDEKCGEQSLTGFNSLLQSWAELQQACRLCVITKSAYQISTDDLLNINQAAANGLIQVAAQEYPHITCRQIDLDINEQLNIEMIWSDIRDENASQLTAWRKHQRWHTSFMQLNLAAPPKRLGNKVPSIKRHGRYLILGYIEQGMGKVWAEQIMNQCHGELILAFCDDGDKSLDTDENWLASIKQASKCQLSLKSHVPANIEGLEKLFNDLLKDDKSTIDGVFLSVPTTNARSTAPLALMQKDHWQHNVNYRLRLIEAFIQTEPLLNPNWCYVQSSMSAVLGGIGLAPYAAANHVLDALIQKRRTQAVRNKTQTCTQWFNVHWDALSQDLDDDLNETSQRHNQALQEFALSNQEVWEITELMLATCLPNQYSVSRSNLTSRYASLQIKESDQDKDGSIRKTHPRPNLETPY